MLSECNHATAVQPPHLIFKGKKCRKARRVSDLKATRQPGKRRGAGALGCHSALSRNLPLFAFIGLESATVPAGDVHEPEKTIPRATILGTLVAAFVYIGVTVVALGVMPAADLQGASAPLAEVAGVMWGAGGAIFIAIGACISTFGTLNGFTMLSGQVPLGAARDGIFPAAFARLTKAGTPAFGLIVSNLLASVLIAMNFSESLANQFEFIILLSTLSTLVPYLLCSMAELMISVRKQRPIATNQSPRVIVLATLGFVYSLWAIYGAGSDVVFWGFLLLMLGLPVFVWLKWQGRASSSNQEVQP